MRSEILGIEPNRVGCIALLLKVVRLPNPSFVISFGFLKSALFFPALRDRWRESEIAKDEGGQVLIGGQAVKGKGRCKDGYFIAPTVIEGLEPGCVTNQDEIFGPVVTLNKFKTEEEVLVLANNTKYGLSATIFTNDLKRAHRVAENIHAGIVWVNTWLLRDLRTPFGGVKNSGVGREGGFEALRFFTEPKNVCIKY